VTFAERCSIRATTGAVAVALVLAASPATAQVNTWNLVGVTFADGGTASGFITYDASTDTIVDWDVSVSGGNEATFPAFNYTSSNSSGTTSVIAGLPQPLLRVGVGGAPGDRQFRVTPTLALDGADPSVPIDTVSNGGSGSVECFNCGPSRLISDGDLVLAAVPVTGTFGRAALAALLLAAAIGTLRRRAAVPPSDYA
jgi:hypothetical protein